MKPTDTPGVSRAEAYELSEDTPTNPSTMPTMGDIIAKRLDRRTVLRGALTTTALAATVGPLVTLGSKTAQAKGPSFDFEEIQHGVDETHHVAPGYDADILIRWGDKLAPDAPDFDPMNQTAAAQEQQFGYNNDYLGFVPLNDDGSRALLCVNHEYTNEELMFPGLGRQDKIDFVGMTEELVNIEMSAHGGSVVEVEKTGGKWQVVLDSKYNRRLTMRTTEMALSGPAAGHDRLKTSADATGRRVIGTLNNCAGGITPWGTYLMAEENFHGYFQGDIAGSTEERNHKRYGVPGGWYGWAKFHKRFDVSAEPNEPNRFGWVTEVDPMDPSSMPKKRTAMGRFKHEGAESIVNADGRVVVYSGDDQRFDYLYKFISAGRYNPDDRAANMDLLDDGTLYVARFNEDGTMDWLPLVHGQGPLTAENGFNSQADVLIETRLAADLLGATPMDRPEDVEPNPATGKVYVMLTNNSKRKSDAVDAANPRGPNTFGHIVELIPPDGDHTAAAGKWEILVKCGDPSVAEVGALWNAATTENGWFASPDNCAVDAKGRLWISTDQGSGWAKTGTADGVWAMETEGELRGTGKMFFRVPVGAEMCGPKFTPDGRALFVAVQHPAADGAKAYEPFGKNSTFEEPATRWPDFKDDMPVRPSVVVITKQDGGAIGG